MLNISLRHVERARDLVHEKYESREVFLDHSGETTRLTAKNVENERNQLETM